MRVFGEKKMAAVLPLALLVLIGAAASWQSAGSHRYINLPGRSDDLPYSNAVLAGNTLYLAGAIGLDPETGAPPERIEDEIRIVMDGIKQRVEMAGMSMDDLVDVKIFCSDISLYEEFNSVYRTYFNGHYPARAFLGSGALLRGGHFEITAIAVRQ